MAKQIIFLLLIAAVLGFLGFYTYENKQYLNENPLENQLVLTDLYKVAADSQNNLYGIVHSREDVIKFNQKGIIVFEIRQELAQGESYSELAVDSKGYIYLLVTKLDSYGLSVITEKIVRYTPDGLFDKVVYRLDYNHSEMLRVGNIKSLQIRNDELIFFNAHKTLFSMNKLSFNDQDVSVIYHDNLPADQELYEIQGTEPNSVYYSTKKGNIYRINEAAKSNLLYSLSDKDQEDSNFPESLTVGLSGKLYFINQNKTAIETITKSSSVQTVNKAALTDVLSMETAKDGTLVITWPDKIVKMDLNGNIIKKWDKLAYSKKIVLLHYLFWGSLLLMFILIVIAVRIIFIHLMKRRFSLILKQIVVFIPIVTVSMVILSVIIVALFSNIMEKRMYRELALLAHNGRNIIDGDRLEKIESSVDYMSEDYKAIMTKKKFLFSGKGVEESGLYSTIYKYENGKLYLIMDDDDSVHMFEPFPLDSDNTRVLEEGIIITDQYTDENGSWMYGIGPLYSSKGKVVGIYETGISKFGFDQDRMYIFKSFIKIIIGITAAILLAFLAMTLFLLTTIRKLRDSVSEMASGNWDTVVSIKTKDEVAELGERFNFMSEYIRKYIAEIKGISEAYFRFVPQQFLKFLSRESILDVKLGDQVESEMNILITNIRSFYLMSKNMTPEDNFNFINSYLQRFGPVIRDNGGLINKYLGSGIQALFPNSSEEALLTAIQMRKVLETYNIHRNNSSYKSIDIGIAIHKGPLMFGIIGEQQRMEGNVISDDVNLAVVLEKITEILGACILITESTLKAIDLPERYQYRSLGMIVVEGKDQPLQLFDVYQGDPEEIRQLKDRTKALFEGAIELYQNGRFFDAREAFLVVIKQNRWDKAAKLYFYLCDEYYQSGTTEDWSGVLNVS